MSLNSYFTIPNQKEIFELSGSELKILTALRAVTYQNKEFLILSEKAKQEILKLLSRTYSAFKPIQRIISRLVNKGIIWLEKSGIYSKVLFQHSEGAKVAPPLYISKEDNSKEATSPAGLKKDQTEIPSFNISERPSDERKNFNSILEPINHIKNEKGINNHSKEQPITREPKNDIKIDNQYIKALKSQMLKYGYSNQDIETTTSLIYKAKNKGVASRRIQDTAKAIIYNRIDKSVKKRPINDLKAFIISSLFSKNEPFIFHKLDHIKDFPYSEIKTESDIRTEQEKKRAAELQQLQQEELKRRSQEQEQYETMKSALMEKLKDKYDTKLEETKKKLVKLNNWFICPEIFAISELFNILFPAGAADSTAGVNEDTI